MTVALDPDTPQLQDKLHILREEANLLRSFRDQLTATNSSLQTEMDQLLDFKKKSEIQQASHLYKIRKLEFNAARLEAERLSSSMIEDMSTFDIEILSANESILLKMYEISEFERKQYVGAVRQLSTALQESITSSKQLESQLHALQNQSKNSDIETRQQCDKLNAEKSKLKEMLKAAKDEILEVQSIESERKERIYELETEVEILKQQIQEYQEKKLDKEIQQLKNQLEHSSREKNELQKKLELLHAVELDNSNLKEKIQQIKSTQSRSMDESIGRIKSAINNCDEVLKRRSTRKPTVQVSSTIFDQKEEEAAEEIFEDPKLGDFENLNDSGKASKIKDPNWSDLEENSGRKKVSKKRKQQAQSQSDAVSVINNNPKPNQPRKLFADRAKSKMFTSSPGLSSVDHPFTDMLQLSGSVASIKDKSKRSRTRSVQNVEM